VGLITFIIGADMSKKVTSWKTLLALSIIMSLSVISVAYADHHIEKTKNKVPPPTANGIAFPVNYQEWDVISVVHRAEHGTIRAVLGNPQAIQAIREGKTNPWPDGVVLGKLVWKNKKSEHVSDGTVPGDFVHAEFMIKDAKKYKETGGWGWARWKGLDQVPFGSDAAGAQDSCIICHSQVEDKDWAFTEPAKIPQRIMY
jgi:hypothetical protein